MMDQPVIAKHPRDLRAFRISPGDSNYFACLFDPLADKVSFTLVVEIFEPGGATPPNTHQRAEEMFFILAGEGVAVADGAEMAIGPGTAFVLRPGVEHVVRNTGPGKLYCLTLMTPDEDFAALIRGGQPVALAEEDLRVIGGLRA
jgi:mannose-6-phosphate isomerase-like protein (cupin superfamily)